MATGQTAYMNGLVNGDNSAVQLINHQGVVQQNLVPVSAPINPGGIPSVINLTSNAHRASVGAGISPVNFAHQSQSSIPASFPVSNQFMIGDYVMPGNVIYPSQSQSRKSEAV